MLEPIKSLNSEVIGTKPDQKTFVKSLDECSHEQSDVIDLFNIKLQDIGWYTSDMQHSFLMDFTTI